MDGQDTTYFEARTSVDHLSVRVRGDPVAVTLTSASKDCYISTFQQQDDTRKEAVKKLIHQFETHPNREASKADQEKDQAFSPFSEKSKDMIRSVGNMEYSEMCEITSKVQLHNCLTFSRQALYAVLAEHACDLQTNIAN